MILKRTIFDCLRLRFSDWAAINDKFRAMNTSMVYGERIGCTIESSWKLVDCVRKGRSFGELANIEFKPEIGTWPWAPVVQVSFIGSWIFNSKSFESIRFRY